MAGYSATKQQDLSNLNLRKSAFPDRADLAWIGWDSSKLPGSAAAGVCGSQRATLQNAI